MTNKGRVAVLLWLLGSVAAIALVARTSFSTDMSAFLPNSAEPTQRVLVEQLRDGIASRLILIGIEGATSAARAEVSRSMAKTLRQRPDFVLIDNGESDFGKADQDYLWRNRYVLSPAVTPDTFSETGLHAALERDLQLLSSGLEPLLKSSLPHDPTGETLAILRRLGGGMDRHLQDGVWATADGHRTLLVAQTQAAGFDIDAQQQDLDDIRQAFAQAQRRVSEDIRLLVTGPGVFGVKTRDEMKHDVTLYSTVAIAVIVGLLLAVYRSPLMLGLTLVPVATGALAGLAMVSLWFGYVHGITVGFGVTLIGESVDYAVYLFAQTRPKEGVEATLGRIWPTLRLGALVSICGFTAMLFSSFTGFVQLGLFTVAGLAVALATTRFILPQLQPAGFAGARGARVAPGLLRLVHRAARLRVPLMLLIAAAVVLIFARSGTLWQDEISSMSPVSPADLQLDRDLRQGMGAPDVSHAVVAVAADREALLQICERASLRLQQLIPTGALAGYDSPDRYLPSEAAQQARKAAIPERKILAGDLAKALDGLPFRAQAFDPFLEDAEAEKTSPPLTRASLDGTALSLKLDSLLFGRPGQWEAIMPLRDVTDQRRIADALADMTPAGTDASVKLLDLKTESDRMLLRYRREALLLVSLGSLAITALLLGHFRSVKRSAAVLAPLAAAVVVTVAVLTWNHRQLSIFNLFGLLLVVAVGSNYCLFFERGGLIGEDGARTATSLLLANFCTVVGFGSLSLSRIPVLYGLGSTVAIGTALSLVAAAILTPLQARA